MTNVFEFPKDKIVREIAPNIEEIEKAKEKSIVNFADSIVDDITSNIYLELENYGLDMDNPSFEKDFYFAMDGLKATVYRILGVNHHLHEFLDKSVTIKKVDEEKSTLDEN